MHNPNSDEIEACDTLIAYCLKMKKDLGLVLPTSEEVAKATQNEMIKDF